MEVSEMASIRKEITTTASLDDVWAALSDIGALHTRLVPGFVVDTRLEPDARIVTFCNGKVVQSASLFPGFNLDVGGMSVLVN